MSNEFRKFTRLLIDNGYHKVRVNGSHYIYQNSDGNTISINKDINRMVKRRIIRENNLVPKGL